MFSPSTATNLLSVWVPTSQVTAKQTYLYRCQNFVQPTEVPYKIHNAIFIFSILPLKNMQTFLFCIFLVVLSASEVSGIVSDSTRQAVQEALFEALKTMDLVTEPSVSDGSIVESQIANEDSKKLQFNAEVLELASQILVEKYGVGILEDANEVLQEMTAVSDSSEESNDS
ncbi:hypothetical protein CRE_18437 [Caenorhabditis remanei]|uniref:Uncharacterized protein n=2 Tax=Caenorhabditis remanei TaxID=31234 RepID=E3LKB5_CAERE|nr:hypothetical protein CRE_18437 [Caenorhabditis remanei]